MAFFAGSSIFLFILLLIGFTSIFWIWMLIDAIRREFRDVSIKIIWIVVVLFGHLLGAIVYYFAGREQGRLPG